MEKEKFFEYLKEHSNKFEWKEEALNGKPGVFVNNKEYETTTHFTQDAIQKHDLQLLIGKTHQGKNIEQITRVTGFFSKTSSWNKGKTAELKDRHRDDLNRVVDK